MTNLPSCSVPFPALTSLDVITDFHLVQNRNAGCALNGPEQSIIVFPCSRYKKNTIQYS